MRSKLFVPAVRPELFTKALAGAADALCFDLEDGVPQARKAEARNNLRAFLLAHAATSLKLLLVRVNHASSSELAHDLDAVVTAGVFALALPKVEAIGEIRAVADRLTQLEHERGLTRPIALLLTIESPRGLRCAAELAQASPRICGLQLGFADLLEPLGISSSDSAARNLIRLQLRLAAAEANLDCYESAYPLFRDEAGFLAQLQEARALGFAGASCIHPGQIDPANRVFSPTPDEIAYAQAVLAAADQASSNGSAIATWQGKMIDRPLLLRAQSILARQQDHLPVA